MEKKGSPPKTGPAPEQQQRNENNSRRAKTTTTRTKNRAPGPKANEVAGENINPERTWSQWKTMAIAVDWSRSNQGSGFSQW